MRKTIIHILVVVLSLFLRGSRHKSHGANDKHAHPERYMGVIRRLGRRAILHRTSKRKRTAVIHDGDVHCRAVDHRQGVSVGHKLTAFLQLECLGCRAVSVSVGHGEGMITHFHIADGQLTLAVRLTGLDIRMKLNVQVLDRIPLGIHKGKPAGNAGSLGCSAGLGTAGAGSLRAAGTGIAAGTTIGIIAGIVPRASARGVSAGVVARGNSFQIDTEVLSGTAQFTGLLASFSALRRTELGRQALFANVWE